MKKLSITLLIVVSLTWGCAPPNQESPAAEATPTTAAGDEITEMDFESGEVTEPEEPAEEPTPDVP